MFESTVTVVVCAVGFAERPYESDPQGRWAAGISRKVWFVDENYGQPTQVKFKDETGRQLFESIKAAGFGEWYHLTVDTSRGKNDAVGLAVTPYVEDGSANGTRRGAKAGTAA